MGYAVAEKPKPGKWVGKTKNLTAKQTKKAVRVVGGGRTEKITAKERSAAKKTAVDIGTTKWQTKADRGGAGRGGLLTGADGKPVTGTVKLPSGKSVQYVRGKRASVMAPAKKTAKPAPRSTGRPGAQDKPKNNGDKKPKVTGLPTGGTNKEAGMPTPKNTGAKYPKGGTAKEAGQKRTGMTPPSFPLTTGAKTGEVKTWNGIRWRFNGRTWNRI
jgi:hypothetical protein